MPAGKRTVSRRRSRAVVWVTLLLVHGEPGVSGDPVAGPADVAPVAEAPRPESDPSTALRIGIERQRLAGLRTETLQGVTLSREQAVQGKVVDISSLLELRTRYRATQAEARIGETTLALAQKNRDRLAKLSQESIIATKDLVAAESTLATEATKATTLRHRLQELREEAMHSWGPELFRLAIEDDSALWEALLKRQKVLVLVALPANHALPAGTRTVHISRNRDRSHAVRADLLSPAPNTDPLVQGETYFFHVDAAHLRTGMRVDAWIPRGGQAARGVFLPASAIVWYGGLPWVYVKVEEDAFQRIAVPDHEEYGDGWFVRSGLKAGDRLVVAGAQLLLSEEMRGQIPREDDD